MPTRKMQHGTRLLGPTKERLWLYPLQKHRSQCSLQYMQQQSQLSIWKPIPWRRQDITLYDFTKKQSTELQQPFSWARLVRLDGDAALRLPYHAELRKLLVSLYTAAVTGGGDLK